MAKKAKEQEPKSRFEKLAQTAPVLPVISDHPLDRENAFDDRFDLCLRLGPVFDIIRHSKTPTPTAIAIYGDWGTGKTSSMKWLEGLINEWNENGKTKDKTTIRTVWFYPWKYHDKDDVWRGLISEVILKGTEIKGANVARVTKAAKQFGLFLGKGFIHTLAALKLKAGGGSVPAEAEFDLACIKDIIGEYDKNIHPEKAFLNEFEKSFEQWLKETLGPNERMVIFIDDLDRCMPQVALGVLEALKLYLNIKQLIFVVGVDDKVIKQLVKKHYENLGLEEDKSGHYLAKMFQTEVTVGPSEEQVVKYLDHHLNNVKYFQSPYLKTEEKKLFRDLINDLADRNPREVKRLINSAVMSGAGVEMLKKAGDGRSNYSFKQGMQVFFIRKILEEDKYDMPRLLGSKRGSAFFREWSQIVCDGREKDKNFPLTITIPEDYQQTLLKYRNIKDGSLDQVSEQMKKRELTESPPDIPMEYYQFIKTTEYFDLLPLLSDKRLGQLMLIEFSADVAKITQEAEPATKKEDDETIIKNAIAKQLEKEPQDLTKKDYDSLTMLNLSDKKITDITLIKKCSNLARLFLRHNQISDIRQFSELTKLTELSLYDNQITDIHSLSKLTNLTELFLGNNQITDIYSLSKLTNLTKLYLFGNQISDLSPLSTLTNLTDLLLHNNHISNISALKGLTNLTRLELYNNQISDISPLMGLTELTDLSLSDNRISDIRPLAELTNLEQLSLPSNQISDIGPLSALANLMELYLGSNQISDISVLAGLTNLIELYLDNNDIQDILPLKDLKMLKELNVEDCENITDKQVDDLQKALPELEIMR